MATPLSGTGTPAPGALPQDTSGGSNLLAFKDALSQVGQLARGERTKLMGGFMAPFSGTVKASDFNQLSQSLGSASDTTLQDYVKNRIAPEYKKPTFDTFTMDNNLYQVQKDSTGQIIGKPTLIQAGVPKDTSTKPIGILDSDRYNLSYPDAGIFPSDTQAQADAKFAASNSPEARTRTGIIKNKDGGVSYETTVEEINNDATIKDKAAALATVKEVYAVEDTVTSPIEQSIATLRSRYNYNSTELKNFLLKEGYPIKEIVESSAGSIADQIGNFFRGFF